MLQLVSSVVSWRSRIFAGTMSRLSFPCMQVRLAKILHQQRNNFSAFIVVHGTDTMAYTASALSLMVRSTYHFRMWVLQQRLFRTVRFPPQRICFLVHCATVNCKERPRLLNGSGDVDDRQTKRCRWRKRERERGTEEKCYERFNGGHRRDEKGATNFDCVIT